MSRFLSPEPNTVLLILSTFAIAAISYHCVENPFRYGLKTKSKLVFATPIAILALALPLRIVHGSPGLPPALKELEEGYRHNVPLESNASSTILATGKGVCLSDPTDQIDILLIGDSHADALARTLGLYAVDKGLSFENLAATGVSITDDQPKLKRLFAGELNEARIKRIKGVKARVGILADAWIWDVNRPNFQAQLNKHLAALSESCETVYVLSQVPMVSLPKTHEKALNKYALALFRSGLEDVGFTEFARISEINTEVKSAVEKLNFRNVEFVDIYPSLIDPNGGVKVISDGKLYYHDYYHIGDRGGQLVMDSGLASRIEQALAPRIAQGLTQ